MLLGYTRIHAVQDLLLESNVKFTTLASDKSERFILLLVGENADAVIKFANNHKAHAMSVWVDGPNGMGGYYFDTFSEFKAWFTQVNFASTYIV